MRNIVNFEGQMESSKSNSFVMLTGRLLTDKKST